VKLKAYEVERSADGKNFVNIGKVIPQNAMSASYHFTDASAGVENYYRIKQVDMDGSFAYSATVALYKAAITKMVLYPNPATQNVRLLLPASKGTVRLMDLNGRVVFSTVIQSNLLLFNTGNFARGVYIVEFAGSNGKVEQEKLILR
jgi:spore germination protein YaaH